MSDDCDAFAKKIGQDHCWAYSPDKAILEDWAHKGPWLGEPEPGLQWRRCTNCGRMEEFTAPETLPPCMEPDGGSCCPQFHHLSLQNAALLDVVKAAEEHAEHGHSATCAVILFPDHDHKHCDCKYERLMVALSAYRSNQPREKETGE